MEKEACRQKISRARRIKKIKKNKNKKGSIGEYRKKYYRQKHGFLEQSTLAGM